MIRRKKILTPTHITSMTASPRRHKPHAGYVYGYGPLEIRDAVLPCLKRRSHEMRDIINMIHAHKAPVI